MGRLAVAIQFGEIAGLTLLGRKARGDKFCKMEWFILFGGLAAVDTVVK